jgi:hypothetical protein
VTHRIAGWIISDMLFLDIQSDNMLMLLITIYFHGVMHPPIVSDGSVEVVRGVDGF